MSSPVRSHFRVRHMTTSTLDIRHWILGTASIAFLLTGCGTRYYSVDGKAVWADGNPAKELEGSQVVFDSTELKLSARGTIGADGSFSISTVNPDDGVP